MEIIKHLFALLVQANLEHRELSYQLSNILIVYSSNNNWRIDRFMRFKNLYKSNRLTVGVANYQTILLINAFPPFPPNINALFFDKPLT